LGSSFTVVDFFDSDDFDLDLSSFVAAADALSPLPLSFFFLDAASSPLELALLEPDEESDDFERDLDESSLELELQIKFNRNVMFEMVKLLNGNLTPNCYFGLIWAFLGGRGLLSRDSTFLKFMRKFFNKNFLI
jgi:hypothetical protein